MAEYDNHQQGPFWDFVRGMGTQHNGAGVDHPAGPPPPFGFFGPPPPPPPNHGSHPFGWGGPGEYGRGGWGGWGGRGRHGRHGRRDRGPPGEENERHRSRSRTASPSGEEHVDGEEANRSGNEEHRRERRRCNRGGRGGFGSRGEGHHPHGHGYGHPHGRHGGPRGPWDRRGPPPPFGEPGAFDLSGLFASLDSHPAISGNPWAQMFRQWAEQAGMANPETNAQRSGETLVDDPTAENTFIPPIDVFSTERAYILHIALPGAKKEDVGVNWDADKSELNIAGVVYRNGDEEFLKTLAQSERKVGVFERSVKLPPGDEEKEEVDGDAIVAKLEDGILMVTVPKVEKEWTEVKRVDIQ